MLPIIIFVSSASNIIEAAANGASLGVSLAIQVGAMLIAFISLVWMVNAGLELVGTSFEGIMSVVFWPFAVLMGIPPAEAGTAAKLLGTKTVLNEFIGYLRLKVGMGLPRNFHSPL